MTIAGRREARFSDITKVRNLGTKFYAMSGKRQTVLVAQNTGGLADLVGETASLGADARDIATNSPTSNTLYILTDDGMQIATLANTPVLGAVVSFDPGDGRWILSTANAGTPYIVTPVDSGIQVLDQAGVRTSVSTPAGVAGCRDAVLGSDNVLYAVDEQRAKIHVWRIMASKAVYIDSFRAKNCRDVIRMALDPTANILFVQCKHRIIGFNVTAAGTEDSAISVTLRQDYGGLKANYTDFAKIGTNKYWIGVDADSALNAAPEYYGRTYAAWDTTNQVLFAAFPDMSIFAASNVVPYVGEIQIPPVPGIPDVPVIVVPPVVPPVIPVTPPAVTPLAPVITSSLTASVTEDSVFNYVITATGTGPITYSLVSPPSWLTGINAVTGAITGIPPDPGTVNVTIRATNAGGSDTEILVVTVAPSVGNNTGVYVNSTVNGFATLGTLVYVVGEFTSVTDAAGTYARNRAACLNASTGRWTSWDPNLNVAPLTAHVHTDGNIYMSSGTITTVGGVSSGRLFYVSPTGALVGSVSVDNHVRAFRSEGADLLIGGMFTTVLATSRSGAAKLTNGTSLSSWQIQTSGGGLLHLSGNQSASAQIYGFGPGGLFHGNCAANGEYLDSYVKGFGYANLLSGICAQESYGLLSAPSGPAVSFSGGVLIPGPSTVLALPNSTFVASTSLTQIASNTVAPTFTGASPFASTGAARVDGSLLIGGGGWLGGQITSVNGDSNAQRLVAITASGGVDSSFSYWTRFNVNGQGSNPYTSAIAVINSTTVVVGGAIGNDSSHLYDGTRVNNILILNSTTGARY